MKKCFKAILSLTLAGVLTAGAALSARAALAPKRIGDTDGDDAVTIMDATHIQRWLADLDEMDKLSQYLGDVDGDGDCSILDATRIQRKLAGFEGFYEDSFYDWYIEDWRMFADYDSGKATVGTPVTFTVEVPGYVERHDPDADGQTQNPTHTFEFSMYDPNVPDVMLLQPRSEINTFTYTFKKPGKYHISCVIYNWVDQTAEARIEQFEVVEPYSLEKPVIVNAGFKDDSYSHRGYSPLYVRAEGGSGSYMYKYTIKTHDQLGLTGGWVKTDDETYTYDWTTEDRIEMPAPQPNDWWPSWTVTVIARDSDGKLSEPVNVEYYREDLPG